MLAHARRIQINPPRARQPEMNREILQSEAFQRAARDIVMLREDPRVDNAAAVNVVAPKRDRSLCNLHPRGPSAQAAAVASQRELHPMAPGALFKIFQVEAKQVVPLDHVGIAFAHDPHQLLEHRALVHRVAAQHALEAVACR